ncbi:MAG: carboxypeptidase-like regulatory domain-containing protein, partial [Candidatus Bathyarchaeia archaeon]
YSTDNSCTLTGGPVSAFVCNIALGTGILKGTFVVAGPTGTYTITATTNGADTREALASFTVTTIPSPSITLSDLVNDYGKVGDTVTVSGSGFLLTDTSCSLRGSIITAATPCSIAGGNLAPAPTFVVGNVAPGVYTVTAKGSPGPEPLATANFLVLPLAPTIPYSTTVLLDIYVPPEFAGLTLSNLWTSFTNNYDSHFISVSRLSASDQIGPNWWKITVSNITVTHSPSSYLPPLVQREIFLANQTQFIRLFQVRSPSTAGRYFFKVFINGHSIGEGNFPTIVVKGSRDPAYISGVLRDSGEHNASLTGQPIQLLNETGAQVVATGIDYLGNHVSAQTFINSTAMGSYTLFGVAPGTYNITAIAAGYIPTTLLRTVSVGPAQSLGGVDIYMTQSVRITGTVLSKSAEGSPIPWGTLFGVSSFGGSRETNRSISVKVLNLDGSVAASIPAPFGFGLQTDGHSTTFPFAIFYQVGFDGRIPQDYANYTSGLASGDYLLYAYVTSYVQLDEVRVHVDNETTQTASMIPLIRTGTFAVTVHFRNKNGTLGPDSIPVDATLTVSAYDARGTLRAQNVTFVTAAATEATVELQGFSNARS